MDFLGNIFSKKQLIEYKTKRQDCYRNIINCSIKRLNRSVKIIENKKDMEVLNIYKNGNADNIINILERKLIK